MNTCPYSANSWLIADFIKRPPTPPHIRAEGETFASERWDTLDPTRCYKQSTNSSMAEHECLAASINKNCFSSNGLISGKCLRHCVWPTVPMQYLVTWLLYRKPYKAAAVVNVISTLPKLCVWGQWFFKHKVSIAPPPASSPGHWSACSTANKTLIRLSIP